MKRAREILKAGCKCLLQAHDLSLKEARQWYRIFDSCRNIIPWFSTRKANGSYIISKYFLEEEILRSFSYTMLMNRLDSKDLKSPLHMRESPAFEVYSRTPARITTFLTILTHCSCTTPMQEASPEFLKSRKTSLRTEQALWLNTPALLFSFL